MLCGMGIMGGISGTWPGTKPSWWRIITPITGRRTSRTWSWSRIVCLWSSLLSHYLPFVRSMRWLRIVNYIHDWLTWAIWRVRESGLCGHDA